MSERSSLDQSIHISEALKEKSPDHTNAFTNNVRSSSTESFSDEDLEASQNFAAINHEFPESSLSAILVAVGSFFGCLVNLGVLNSIGAIQAYVATHQLSDLSASSISWIFSIYLALAYSCGIFIGSTFDKHGPLYIMIASSIFWFMGFMGSASSTNVWQFILSFICLGLGNGLGLTPCLGVLSHWFLKYRGQYTGLATSGGAIGGLIFPLMLRHTLKVYGYTWAMRIWGFTCLGFMIISTCLIRTRFKREVNPDDIVVSKWRKFTGKFSKKSFKKFHDKTFCYLVLAAFFTELALVLLLTYFPTYCIANGVSESTSYILITVWNAFGIGGRWIPGILSDKLGMFNTNFVILTLFSLSILVILLPFGHALNVMYAFAACGGFFSGIISFLPTLISQVSPVHEVGERYSTINCFLSMANLFGVPIASAIINKGTVHDYDMFVIFVGILAALGTGFYLVTRWMLVGYRLNIKV